MKPKFRASRFSSLSTVIFAGVLASAGISQAAIFYWDNNSTTAGFGTASGTWNTSVTTVGRWTTSSTGVLAGSLTQTTTNADSYNFGTAADGLGAGTITVGTAVAGNITYGSASGAIVLSGGTLTLAAAQTTTVNNASDTINTVLAGAATSFTKAGTGTLILTGANTYTGSTIINQGTINLGGSTATGSLASTVLTLGGGSLSYTRTGGTTQGFTTTNFNASLSGLSVVATNILNLGTVTRGLGATFDFSTTGAGTVGALAANNTAGIMGGFTFGNSWAVANGAGVAISALADASYTLSSAAGTTSGSYTGFNIDVDNSAGAIDAGITTNSLRFSTAAANTMSLTGANVISTGGILVGSGVGNNLSTITGGTLTGSASKDLVIVQNNTSNGLTIASNIINSTSTSITKSGAGLLTLSGTNSFTGGLSIFEGTVEVGSVGALNSTAGSENAVTFTAGSTGRLAINGTSVVIRSLNTNATTAGSAIVENASATPATLTIGNSLNLASTFAGVIQDGTGGGALKLVKTGTGILTLGGNNTFSGGYEINAGQVNYDSSSNANIWGASSNIITFTGNATLHNNNNAYTLARGIQVNGGVTATLSGAFGESTNITGAVTGTGDVNISGGSNGWAVTMSNTANSLSGTVWVSSNSGQNTTLTVNSLADGAVGKKLKMGAGTATAVFTLQGSSVTPTVWTNRQVELAGTTGAISISNNSSNAAATLTISPNLAFTTLSSGNKTLTLGGSNAGNNTFAGNITNNGTSTTTISKTGTGTWELSGDNTYSGVTTVSSTGALTLSGDNIGAAGGITMSTASATGPRLNVNSATALGTGTLNFGGGLASDVVRLDNTSGSLVTVSTINAFTLNRNFTFIGTNSLTLGTGVTTIGGITAPGSRSITVTANTLTFAGAIGENVADLGVTKLGAGKLAFNGDASYTGTTLISNGVLELGGTAGRLSGTTTTTITNNANLTINRSNAFTQATDLGAGVAITGTGSFTQAGAGTTTLTATNGYTGATTVANGTLLVNGSISTSVLTTVQTGATLGGSGTVGALTIDVGGILAPGNSPGIMTVDGNYIQNGSLNLEITGLTPGVTGHDQVIVDKTVGSGTVTLNGALSLTFNTFTPVNGDLIFILLNDDVDAISGTFTGLADGDVAFTNYLGFDWEISYFANNTGVGTGTFIGGNDVALMAVAIPEPRAALLGTIGVICLLRRRR